MPFKVSDNKILKRYTKIWEKISNSMNIEFDSECMRMYEDRRYEDMRIEYEDKCMRIA